MTKGVLLFAQNNSKIDYIKQAQFCASRIKEHLGLPVCLATDNTNLLETNYKNYKEYFDNIIQIDRVNTGNRKRFSDGIYGRKITLEWFNYSRIDAYDITPYDETIVMDTDVLISNNVLLECFENDQTFMIAKESKDIRVTSPRATRALKWIGDHSIEMVWATLFYFKKNKEVEMLFRLMQHIRENYNYYRLTFAITETKYRNDFVFAMAIHIINGRKKEQWPHSMPGNLWHTLDLDHLVSVDGNELKFLLENEYEYYPANVSGLNVHVMNKFSLSRIVNEYI
jgi:hypothetical protein